MLPTPFQTRRPDPKNAKVESRLLSSTVAFFFPPNTVLRLAKEAASEVRKSPNNVINPSMPVVSNKSLYETYSTSQ